MCCPLKEIKNGKWVCGIANQECPEATIDGFDYEWCSTYLEHLEMVYWR